MPEQEIMVFWLGEEEYGIDINEIQEISRLKEIVINPVPKVPEFVEGIINLRGDVVPVIDTKSRLGLKHAAAMEYARIIIINVDSRLAGILVDGISGVINPEAGCIHDKLQEMDEKNEFIQSIVKLENRMIFKMDTVKLLGL